MDEQIDEEIVDTEEKIEVRPEPVKQEVESIGEAIAIVSGILPDLVLEKNLGPGRVFNHSTGRYFLMYKREYYKNFKNHFPNVVKSDGKHYGWAQIMNKELLNYAAHDSNNIDWVLFVTPDGKAYRAASRLFKKFVDKHNTECPHLPGEVAMPLDYFNNLEEEINYARDRKSENKVQSSISQTNAVKETSSPITEYQVKFR